MKSARIGVLLGILACCGSTAIGCNGDDEIEESDSGAVAEAGDGAVGDSWSAPQAADASLDHRAVDHDAADARVDGGNDLEAAPTSADQLTFDREDDKADDADDLDVAHAIDVSAERASIAPDVGASEDAAASDVSAVGNGDAEAGEPSSRDSASSGDRTVEDSATESASASLRACVEHCAIDQDCARPGTARWSCNPDTHLCTSCYDDLICVAGVSGWTSKRCTADSDCFRCTDGGCTHLFGDYCIEVDHTGYCAFDKDSTTSCDGLPAVVEVKKLGSDERVQVCSKSTSRCDGKRGYCITACRTSATCTAARGGKTCDVASGRCQCASADDCGPEAPVCNPITRQCECSATADCNVDGGRALVCE